MTVNIISWVPAYAGGEGVTLTAPNIPGSGVGQNFTGPNDILIGTGVGTFVAATMGDILDGTFFNPGGPNGYSYFELRAPIALINALDVNSNNIINVVDPIADQDAATKIYVDTAVGTIGGGFLPLSGGTMLANGNITMGAGGQILLDFASAFSPSITFIGEPDTGMYRSAPDEISFTNALAVGNSIFTMESDGTLNVAGQTDYELQVTSDDDIPNKKYVDDALSTGYLPLIGGTITGDLTIVKGTPAIHLDSSSGEGAIRFYDAGTLELSMGYFPSTDRFQITNTTTGTILDIEGTGEIKVLGGYESLVTTDNVLTNKKYVDDAIINDGGTLYLALAGGTMTGTITFSGGQLFPYDNASSGLTATDMQSAIDEIDSTVDGIIANNVTSVFGRDGNVVAASGDYAALEITYVNTTSSLTSVNVQNAIDELDGIVDGLVTASGTYLELAGGTMTGDITFSGTQLFPYDNTGTMITATDIDAAVTELDVRVDNIENALLIGPFLPLTGGGLTGSLFLNADPTANLEAATKQYVDTEITNLNIGSFLPLAGGTMTGDILGLTTLTVGDHVLGASDYQSGLGGNSFLITTAAAVTSAAPTYSFVGATDMGMYSSGVELRFAVGGTDRITLPAGSGVSVNTNRITDVVDPVNDQDAVTKKWITDMTAVRLLGSALTFDLTAGAGTGVTILTVPVGKTHMYTQLVVRARSYNPGASPVNADISVGSTTSGGLNVMAQTTVDWGGIAGASDQAIVIPLGANGSPSSTPNPGDAIQVKIQVPAGGTFTSLDVDVHLVGMEIPTP